MSRVIEISDSDDELQQHPNKDEESTLQITPAPTNSSEGESQNISSNIHPANDVSISGSMSPPPLIISEVTSINESFSTILAVDDRQTPTTTGTSAVSTVNTSNSINKQQIKHKRSRRKSMHHPLCASPEIEFETIALDDDEDNTESKSKNISSSGKADGQDKKSAKSHKITSKILNTKSNSPSFETQLSNACTEFLNSDETNALLRQIAEDRVRINFLLASYNMPEIQFSLNTLPEVLQFQLDERIKNRRSRFMQSSNQLKKRRSLLQNSTARTGT